MFSAKNANTIGGAISTDIFRVRLRRRPESTQPLFVLPGNGHFLDQQASLVYVVWGGWLVRGEEGGRAGDYSMFFFQAFAEKSAPFLLLLLLGNVP